MSADLGKIFLAGHNGLVGRSIRRSLLAAGYDDPLVMTRQQLDLTDQRAVFDFFAANKPQTLIVAAAIVGGIKANNERPGTFIGGNLMIATNLLEAARRYGTNRVLQIQSGCMYPRHPPLPTTEDALFSGELEPTNRWYAVAKIASTLMGDAYAREFGMHVVSLVPCNIYGPYDNFDLESSHVIPALLLKFQTAKEEGAAQVNLWGTGTPTREFIHVDDLGAACLCVLENQTPTGMYNCGSGISASIAEVAEVVRETVGYSGEVAWDGKLDGCPSKMLDSSKLRAIGWEPRIPLAEGLRTTYEWLLVNKENLRMSTPTPPSIAN